MKAKKKGNNWTAYYNPETERYFAEIMYTSREGREQLTMRSQKIFTVGWVHSKMISTTKD